MSYFVFNPPVVGFMRAGIPIEQYDLLKQALVIKNPKMLVGLDGSSWVSGRRVEVKERAGFTYIEPSDNILLKLNNEIN